jgi:hypothetical protein
MAADAKSYEILSRIIAQAAARLNVMDLQTLDTPAGLATPAIPLQNFLAELAISLRLEFQAWPFGSTSSQGTPERSRGVAPAEATKDRVPAE